MEAYDLSHKLAYAGRLCRVPFTTGPEFTNSVPIHAVIIIERIALSRKLHSIFIRVPRLQDFLNVLPVGLARVPIIFARARVFRPEFLERMITAHFL